MKYTLLYILVSLTFLSFIGITQVDRWKAPEEAKKLKNPTKAQEKSASILRGAKIFKFRCMVCHGQKGKGDGIGGKALTPKPQNLTLKMVKNQTDGELFWKVSNGRNDMIKWEPILLKEQRWDVVNYIKTLK